MAFIADGIDFLTSIMDRPAPGTAAADRSRESKGVGICYLLFTFLWIVIWGRFSDKDFSAILTFAAYTQCLAFVVLSLKVHGSRSVSGISSQTLVMYVMFFVTRLTSTSLRNGYIPVDRTGDFLYQAFDGASLLLCVQLLYAVHKKYGHSYEEEHDSLPVVPLLVPCAVLGFFCHGSFNGNEFFDIVWAVSTNIETVVMVPQLWMLAKMGGKVDAVTAHFVATVVLANVMTFTWWWYCGAELEKRGPCPLAKVILVAQLFKLFLSADFMFYYAQAWINGTSVVLPESTE